MKSILYDVAVQFYKGGITAAFRSERTVVKFINKKFIVTTIDQSFKPDETIVKAFIRYCAFLLIFNCSIRNEKQGFRTTIELGAVLAFYILKPADLIKNSFQTINILLVMN